MKTPNTYIDYCNLHEKFNNKSSDFNITSKYPFEEP